MFKTITKKSSVLVKVAALMFISVFCLLFEPAYALENLDLKIRLDGKEIVFPDARPYIDASDRVLVPVRFIAENMGALVTWNQESRTVTIRKEQIEISLKIGEYSANVSKSGSATRIEFDTKAILLNDRTFVPLRFISETLGAMITWDDISRTVDIASLLPGPITVTPTPSPIISTPSPKPSPSIEPIRSNYDFNEHPLIAELSKIQWLRLGIKLETGTYTLGFYRPGSTYEAMELLYAPSSDMFAIDLFWATEETIAMAKLALEIARPEIADQVYPIMLSLVGNKGSNMVKYIGKYCVVIVHRSSAGIPFNEQGVRISTWIVK